MKPTLVVLAAGMGSRFGGVKQIAPVGLNGECLLDYSSYDAVKSGFGKVIFIIRRDIEQDFRERLFDHIARNINAEYVFQDFDANFTDQEKDVLSNLGRTKPWGTTHALLCAEDKIHEPFAIINADDYYGREAFEILGKHLSSVDPDSTEQSMVGYVLGNTMSRNGSVSRGVCSVKNGLLSSIHETHEIYYDGENFSGKNILYREDGAVGYLTGNEIVSMNLFGFTPKIFGGLHNCWEDFKRGFLIAPKAEALIPSDIGHLIKTNKYSVKVFTSNETWFGMTYAADKQVVQNSILDKIESGYYPEVLWNK